MDRYGIARDEQKDFKLLCANNFENFSQANKQKPALLNFDLVQSSHLLFEDYEDGAAVERFTKNFDKVHDDSLKHYRNVLREQYKDKAKTDRVFE